MASDPQYVKLSYKASRGMLVDLDMGSGFSISGKDVREFPTEKQAVKYVRRELKRGNIVVASAVEFEEAKEGDEALPADAELPHQEHRIREALAQGKESGTPDSEPSSSSDSEASEDGGDKGKKDKGSKGKKKSKEKKSKEPKSGGEAYTRDELSALGQDELKALLEANSVEVDGRFSKAKAVDALIEASATK